MTLDGKEYIGYYYMIGNDAVPGKPNEAKLTDKPQRLIPYNPNPDYVKYINLKNDVPYLEAKHAKSFHPNPVEEDYKRGYIYRYFVKKRNDTQELNIVEVSEENFKQINETNLDLYTTLKIKWLIVGRKENLSFSQKSITFLNKETIYNKEKDFKGIKKKVFKFDEFVRFI